MAVTSTQEFILLFGTSASRKNIYVRSLDKVVPQSSGLLESYDAQSGQPGPSLPIPSVWRDLWVADDSVVYALRSGSTVRYVLAPLTGRVQTLWVDQQGGRLINVLSADRFLVAPTDHTTTIVNRRGEILVQRFLGEETASLFVPALNRTALCGALYKKRPSRGFDGFPRITALRFSTLDATTLRELDSKVLNFTHGRHYLFSWDLSLSQDTVAYIFDDTLQFWKFHSP